MSRVALHGSLAAFLTVIVACGSRTGLFLGELAEGQTTRDAGRSRGGDDDDSSDDDNTSSSGSVPPNPPLVCRRASDAISLDFVNDLALSADDYVAQCKFTQAQADTIVALRPFESMDDLEKVLPIDETDFCDDFTACAQAHARARCIAGPPSPVVLELVVDESGSMTGEKWDALRDSLLELFENIANDGDTDVQVGLVTFDDQTLDQISPAPLSPSQRIALESAVDRSAPHGGGTATRNALDRAYEIANRVSGVRRVLVLFSDGAPSRGSVEQEECEDRVRQETRDRGSKLFSVGIGVFDPSAPSSYDPAFMGRLAVAGGTAPRGCDPTTTSLTNTCHFQVTPGTDPTLLQKQFTAALDAIRTAVICP